jgi:DNA ligase D-like protein (predicted 3'-phosphoesterase)
MVDNNAERVTGRFVVQEHDATTHHFDFRLELDGVLKSWAVPKGVSTKPGERRLAVAVEDHSCDYVDFEGEIEEGQYGAGTVTIWDRGIYELVDRKPNKLVFVLHGEKLTGSFVLVHTKEKMWIIMKMKKELDEET